MQIKYSTESNLVRFDELMLGDCFVWDHNAWVVADISGCSWGGNLSSGQHIAFRPDTGLMQIFIGNDKVLPMPQSIIEVKA